MKKDFSASEVKPGQICLCMSLVSFCLLFFLQRHSTKSPFFTSDQSTAVSERQWAVLVWQHSFTFKALFRLPKSCGFSLWVCRLGKEREKNQMKMQKCLSENAQMLSRREPFGNSFYQIGGTQSTPLSGDGWHLPMGFCCGSKYLPRQYILPLYSRRVEYPHVLSLGSQSTRLLFF